MVLNLSYFSYPYLFGAFYIKSFSLSSSLLILSSTLTLYSFNSTHTYFYSRYSIFLEICHLAARQLQWLRFFFFSVRICAEFVSPRHSFFTSLLFWILICPCCCYRNMPQCHFYPSFLAAGFYRYPTRRRAPHCSDPAPAPEAWPSAALAHSGPCPGCCPMVSQAKALGCCTSCPNQLQVQPTFVDLFVLGNKGPWRLAYSLWDQNYYREWYYPGYGCCGAGGFLGASNQL